MQADKNRNKKNEKWRKPRHRIYRALVEWAVLLYTRLAYRIRVPRFKRAKKEQFLIMMNHQTAFDQFFVEMAFRTPVYYVASEDLFSKGWLSRVIEHVVAPIPIKKSVTDMRAVRTCVKVAREGGTIALAPEGNRTFSGVTETMKPSIVGLVRLLKLPIAIFRIEGGYGVHPRWSDVLRRGRMHAAVTRVIEVEEWKALSDEQLFALIEQQLYVDDTALGGEYPHKKCAEYLERVMYVCPDCGLSEWESHGDVVHCKKCGRSVRYCADLHLEGLDRPFPFAYVKDWYAYQENFICDLLPEQYAEQLLYEDEASLARVILYRHKEMLADRVSVRLWGTHMELDGQGVHVALPFDEVQVMSVLGRNKLNIYIGEDLYQLKGDKRFNPVKYMNFYYRYQNANKGEHTHGQFLGL